MVGKLPDIAVKEINNHIDHVTINENKNYADYLVGQISQDKKSSQLDFDLKSPYGKSVKEMLNGCATALLTEGYKRQAKADAFECWTVHSYAGDYNPLHEHGTVSGRGVSMIAFLKVPPQIAKLEENFVKHEAEGGSNINLQHGNSGKTDGLTQFVWEANSMYDVPRFKHAPFAHVYPSIGKIAVFPIWMLHQVSPFYGEGERRTMSCNIDIINYD